MSCHAAFTSCRFVWSGDLCALSAFELLNPLNSSQEAAGQKYTEKKMLRNWFCVVSLTYFSSLSLAAFAQLALPSPPAGAVFCCYLLMRCIASFSICPTSCSPFGFC